MRPIAGDGDAVGSPSLGQLLDGLEEERQQAYPRELVLAHVHVAELDVAAPCATVHKALEAFHGVAKLFRRPAHFFLPPLHSVLQHGGSHAGCQKLVNTAWSHRQPLLD